MKTLLKLCLLSGLMCLSLSTQAAGTISGPGWYYPAYPVSMTPTYATIFLKGAYADETTCEQTKWLDYDTSDGIKPWDGGAGCHYIYANDIDAINEIYSLAFNPGSDPIIGLNAEQLADYIDQVNVINEAHDIKVYKAKVNRLIDSLKQTRR